MNQIQSYSIHISQKGEDPAYRIKKRTLESKVYTYVHINNETYTRPKVHVGLTLA